MAQDSEDRARELLEREIPHLRRYARSLVRNGVDADDLVQESLVSALENIGSWRAGSNMRAWLFVILRNKFLNTVRKTRNESNANARLEIAVNASTSNSDRHRIQTAVLEVKQAFALLTDEHREILTLVAVEGLTYEETAEVLNVAVGTVRSRLARARRRLKELIDEGREADAGAEVATASGVQA